MQANLDTTNLFLGIMAVVSLLEGLLLVGVGVGAWIAYRRVMTLVNGIEQRQIAPAMARINSILDNLKDVSSTVKQETERVDHAISGTMERVDETAERVRHSVADKVNQATGVLRGIRAVVASVLRSAAGRDESAPPVSPSGATSRT